MDVHICLCFFTGWRLLCPESPSRISTEVEQPQSLGVPVVMDTASGGEDCEELTRIPPREPHAPGYWCVEQQRVPEGMGLSECDLALRES